MPELTFNEQILEEFDKEFGSFHFHTPDCVEHDEFDIKYFIEQALDRQRDEFMKCLPEFKVRKINDEDFIWELWNDYREQLLDNLKKAKLIE